MATKKASVSDVKKSANKTTSNLVNLPTAVRRSKTYTPDQKVLLNELVGLYYIARSYGRDSFFKENAHFVKVMDVCENKFRAVREKLVDMKIVRYIKPTKDSGFCTTYYVYPEKIQGWNGNVEHQIEGVQNSSEGVQNGGSKKSLNSLDNTELRGSNQGFKNQPQSEGDLNPPSTADDNQNDDNKMTKFEMQCKIFAELKELRTEVQLVREVNEALRELNKTLVAQNGELLNLLKSGVQIGVQNPSEGVQNRNANCAPYIDIYTYPDTEEEKKEKEDKGTTENYNAHTHETQGDGVFPSFPSSSSNGGVETRNAGDGIQTQLNALNHSIASIIDRWNQEHDNAKAEELLKPICNALRDLRPRMTPQQWTMAKSRLDSFFHFLHSSASQMTQTPQQPQPIAPQTPQTSKPSKEVNNEVSKVFQWVRDVKTQWNQDHDNDKADGQFGLILDYIDQLYQQGASENQFKKIHEIVRDYYVNVRKMSGTPDKAQLLTTRPKEDTIHTTEAISEPFLTRLQAQMIETLPEDIKSRRIASKSVNSDWVDQGKILTDIADTLNLSFSSWRTSKNEARRLLEIAKDGLRKVYADPDKFDYNGYKINTCLISRAAAIEFALTNDPTPIVSLYEIAKTGDEDLHDFIEEMFIGIQMMWEGDDNTRHIISKLKLNYGWTGKRSQPQQTPAEPTHEVSEARTDPQSTTANVTSGDDLDELPF